MRALIAVGVAVLFLTTGCFGGDGEQPVFAPVVKFSDSREKWIANNAPGRPVGHRLKDPALHWLAEATSTRVIDATVFDFGVQEGIAMRVQSDNPASWLIHDQEKFVHYAVIGKGKLWLVELYDEDGRHAWGQGIIGTPDELVFDTMSYVRPDLVNCYPPCPKHVFGCTRGPIDTPGRLNSEGEIETPPVEPLPAETPCPAN